jgi:acetyltransferase-like isoleucine patch superfamily enzyme
VRIQAFAFLPEGVTVEDDVFIGPHACFTNDRYPDPVTAAAGTWERLPTLVRKGASIGAGAVILPGLTIGERALVGAGAVVTRDVEAGAVVRGNPARPTGARR